MDSSCIVFILIQIILKIVQKIHKKAILRQLGAHRTGESPARKLSHSCARKCEIW